MPRILVGEDDSDIRELVTYKLQQVGYQVTAVEDGVAALDCALRAIPDLVILDVMMPGMSGFEVCRELRQRPCTADVPVMLLTARAQEHDIDVGLEAGAHDYIVKPFSVRELISRVGSRLEHGSP